MCVRGLSREHGGGGEVGLARDGQPLEQGRGLGAERAGCVLPLAVAPEEEGAPPARVIQLAPLIDRRPAGVGDVGREAVRRLLQRPGQFRLNHGRRRLQLGEPGKKAAVVIADRRQLGIVEQQRLLHLGPRRAAPTKMSSASSKRVGAPSRARSGSKLAWRCARSASVSASTRARAFQRADEAGRERTRRDLQRGLVGGGGGLGLIELLQQETLREVRHEMVGLERQGVVQRPRSQPGDRRPGGAQWPGPGAAPGQAGRRRRPCRTGRPRCGSRLATTLARPLGGSRRRWFSRRRSWRFASD